VETNIHPTAIIEEGVELDQGVMVGPFSLIGSGAKIGSGTKIDHHSSVVGRTQIGCDCMIFPYSFIGAKSQDIKSKGDRLGVVIGDRNIFREYTTVHAASRDDDITVIGNDCLLCAYSHVAHDCFVGNHLIMSSHAALGGHVLIEDHVNIAWGSGVHQFCRIGSYSMLGACAKLVQDVPPFMICEGNPAEVRTINTIGLQRAGFSEQEIQLARRVYRIIYREGMNRSQALDKLMSDEESDSSIIRAVIRFANESERGFA